MNPSRRVSGLRLLLTMAVQNAKDRHAATIKFVSSLLTLRALASLTTRSVLDKQLRLSPSSSFAFHTTKTETRPSLLMQIKVKRRDHDRIFTLECRDEKDLPWSRARSLRDRASVFSDWSRGCAMRTGYQDLLFRQKSRFAPDQNLSRGKSRQGICRMSPGP